MRITISGWRCESPKRAEMEIFNAREVQLSRYSRALIFNDRDIEGGRYSRLEIFNARDSEGG
jgi:hypothetical protein